MDGQIVGERLVGGSVSAEKLDITYRNQVIKEIADAEESARSDAEDYTDGELKKYYTKVKLKQVLKIPKILFYCQQKKPQNSMLTVN